MARPKSIKSETEGASTEGGVTKTAAVRDALKTLGRKTKPADVHDYVLNKFGIDMSLNHISNIKSGLKGKRGGGRKKRKMAETAVEAAPAALPRPGNGRTRIIELEDIEATKELVQKVGPSNLHALIELVRK